MVGNYLSFSLLLISFRTSLQDRGFVWNGPSIKENDVFPVQNAQEHRNPRQDPIDDPTDFVFPSEPSPSIEVRYPFNGNSNFFPGNSWQRPSGGRNPSRRPNPFINQNPNIGRPINTPPPSIGRQINTPAPNNGRPSQTGNPPSQSQMACERSCLSTNQYDPVCGDDQQTYFNEGKLKCAQNCGRGVRLIYRKPCSGT